MAKQRKTSLKRKMVFYFLMVAIANVFLAIELLWEIRSESYRAMVIKQVTIIKNGDLPVEHIFSIMDGLTEKFIIMVGILIIVSAVVLFLYVIQIASPIQYMLDKAKKIAQGDLSLTIDLKSQDEIADLGNLINDLTVNLQEIIVQMKLLYSDFEEGIVNLEAKLKIFPEIAPQFTTEQMLLQETIETMSMLKESFTLYQFSRLGIGDLSPKSKLLIENLLSKGLITNDQCEEVMNIQKERGGYTGAILKELGYITDHDMVTYSETIEK